MKKLGKKNQEMIETVEAYRCGCSGLVSCWPVCGDSNTAYSSSNNNLFNTVYADVSAE